MGFTRSGLQPRSSACTSGPSSPSLAQASAPWQPGGEDGKQLLQPKGKQKRVPALSQTSESSAAAATASSLLGDGQGMQREEEGPASQCMDGWL